MKASEGGRFQRLAIQMKMEEGILRIQKRRLPLLQTRWKPGLQARNFIAQVGNLTPEDFPPILDLEKTDGLSADELNDRVIEWLRVVEKLYGRKPIIYANPHYLNNILSPEITQSYPVWAANYGVTRPGWRRWQLWQFTARALVRGVGCAA